MRVILENLTPHARTSWARVVVPTPHSLSGKLGDFALIAGRRLNEELHVGHVKATLGPFERYEADLVLDADRAVELPDLQDNQVPPVFLSAGGGNWQPQGIWIEDGPCYLLRLRGRIPTTMLVATFWAWVYPGSQVVEWELLVVNSDPRSPDLYQPVTELVLEIGAPCLISPYWPRWKSTEHVRANAVRLLRETVIVDSQGQAWSGAIVTQADSSAAASLVSPIAAIASAQDWAGKWGPFGVLPRFEVLPAAYKERMVRFLGAADGYGDPWRAPRMGLAPNSGQTGAQDDFGATKLGWAHCGGPGAIIEAYHSALHEACRPGQFVEADGTPVEAWNHPDHITWSGYTHWHSSYSGDRLGKGLQATPRWSGGYYGPDREHWSNNVLCGTYLLTGSPALLEVLSKQARQFLSGETLDPRLPSTSGVGAPRGIGRSLLAASWVDCCLPEGRLRDELRARVHARIEQRVEPSTRPPAGAVVTPLGTSIDPRRMNGVECWSWEEPIGIVGLRAAELRFGSSVARIVLERAARSWLEHAWWHDGQAWRMADLVAYLEGQPPPAEAYPTVANPVPVWPPLVVREEGFEEWAGGALEICSALGLSKADTILAERPIDKIPEAEWRAAR